MKKEYNFQDSLFLKQNMKIQKNLCKAYSIVLLISLFVILAN